MSGLPYDYRSKEEIEAKAKFVGDLASSLIADHEVLGPRDETALKVLIHAVAAALRRDEQPSLALDDWHLPDDATKWKKAKDKLKLLAKKARETSALLDEILEDETTARALGHVVWRDEDDPDGGVAIGALVSSSMKLCETACAAAELPARRGRPGHPHWYRVAARLCEAFWARTTGEKKPARSSTAGLREGRQDPNGWAPFTYFYYQLMCAFVPDFEEGTCNTVLGVRNKGSF